LPDTAQGVVVVLENGCDTPFTYQINGREVEPLGHGDLHDAAFDDKMLYASFRNVTSISDGTARGMILNQAECAYAIRIYPSATFVAEYTTSTPMVITLAVAIVFVFTLFMFFVYDRLVERRQKILLDKATRTHQIVASLFPKHVRDQVSARIYGKIAFIMPCSCDKVLTLQINVMLDPSRRRQRDQEEGTPAVQRRWRPARR